MASNRSRKFRSITGRISEIDKQLGSVNRNLQSTANGLGTDAVSSDSLLSESVGSDAIQIESITADKIAPSVFESASSGIQRVPNPLTSVDYWNSAIYGNITGFSNAYFANKENKNVEATEQGVLFSPEANSSLPISKTQLLEGGIVLITTDSAHGYEVGDYITVTNLDSPFDGEWVITIVPSVTTMCYSINQYEESSTNLDTGAYIVVGEDEDEDISGYKHSVVRKSFIDGVATLTLIDETDTTATSGTHGYEVGYVINVSGLGSPYDGTHKITYVTTDKSAVIQYRPDNSTVEEFVPSIALTSAWGNGTNITYDSDDIHGISLNQIVKITGFSTGGYNLTGRVNGVYGSGSTFTIPSATTTTSPDTGGTYSCLNASVSVEADAVLFLTGKNPVPSSRSVVISWVSNNPIKFYAVVWQSSTPDFPLFTEIDAEISGDVSYLPGLNNYAWEIPEGIDYYAVYAEVLPGSPEALLKECYVFESVGDSNKKVEKIVNASVEAVANSANKVTLYTSSTHPYNVDDTILLSGMETISDTLNKKFTVSAVADDKKSFSVSVPVVNMSVATTSASFTVNTNPVYNDITGLSSALDVSGKIYIGQPFTSSNVTALPNSTVTAIQAVTTDATVKTGLVATLVSGNNTVTLTTGNTEGIFSGQILLKTSGTGAFATTGTSFVDTITGNTTFTTTTTHATSGSTTFSAAVRTTTQSSFRVNNVSAGTNSDVTLSFYLPNTESTSAIALSATAIGGFAKEQTSTISPVGLSQNRADGSQGVNLTDDSRSDNYLSVTTSIGESVASISATGTGTFKTLDADSLSVDNDITIGGEGTPLVGNFINEKFNGKSYGGSLLDRLARGTIYQASWLTPVSGTNIPANTQYYGLAAGTFKLDADRLYQMFVSAAGMRASTTAACAFEIMFSTTPIRVEDDAGLAKMAHVVPARTITTSAASAGTAHTHTVNVFTNFYWSDLQGHFYSISPTPVASNMTNYTISSWSRASSNANIVLTLSNTNAGKYLESVINNSTKMYAGINVNNSTYNYLNGTYEIEKINKNQYRIVTSETTLISAQTNAGMTLTLVDPIITKTKLTFDRGYVNSLTGTIVSGSNTITGISSTANISVGDNIYRVSGANLADTTVTNVINTTAITVSNTSANTSGITFDVNRTVCTSNGTAHTYFIENFFKSGQLVDVVSTNTSWSVAGGLVVYADATKFTITFSSPTPQANASSNIANVSASYSDTQVQLHKNYLPSDTDLYYVIRLRHGASTFDAYPITVSENPNGMMAVTDLGQAKDVTFVAQRNSNVSPWTTGLPVGFDTVSSTTTVVTETQTLEASDSAYYDNYGRGVSLNFPQAFLYYLYQGNTGGASGTKKSAVLFPAFDFTNKTSGLTITKLEVYLRNRHSYNSNGLTAYIAAHAATTLGSSVPLALDAPPATTSTFTKGQGKWVDLPASWYSSFTSGGTGRGILLGTTDENPDTYYDAIENYGYFDGVTLDDAPQLRVTYRYNAPISENNSEGSTGGGGGGYVVEV